MTRISQRGIAGLSAIAVVLITSNIATADIAELVTRAQSTQRPKEDDLKEPRVKRNAKGEIAHLNLDYVRLQPGDMEHIAKCKTLERLSLSRTSITDDELKQLIVSDRLRGLRLNHTRIGDAGLRHLAKMKSLRSVCLGGVNVSREAREQLRKDRPDMGVGYFPKQGE